MIKTKYIRTASGGMMPIHPHNTGKKPALSKKVLSGKQSTTNTASKKH